MPGLIGDILFVILLGCASTLCLALTIAVVRIAPPLLRTARNLDKISGDFAAASQDIAEDLAKTAHNAAGASENALEASSNMVSATGDFADAMATLAAVARMDMRAILTLFANGNIGDLKDLASYVAQNIPQATSRIGSIFRRGSG